ncbi:MAG: T9SS type A sorting domain-containing protein [Bacteroidales bacterium]|nr:T9SS type A sorting domain-containing protein [Bacteroidales bacterium]
MKKVILVLLAGLLLTHANAQTTPQVDITIDSLSATTVTASFAKNDATLKYGCLISDEATLEMWAELFGLSDTRPLIIEWAYECLSDTTWHWTEMTPSTPYKVYAVAYGANDTIIYSVDALTLTQGDSATSEITITIGDLTWNSAQVIVAPNASTAYFKDMVMEGSYFDAMTEEEVIDMLKEDPYMFYDTDDWTWTDLNPSTTYVACAIGTNAIGEWGPLAVASFLTDEHVGIAPTTAAPFTVMPNPTQGRIEVEGNNIRSLTLFDMQGRKLLTTTESSLDLSAYPNGTYILRADYGGRYAVQQVVKKGGE